MLKTKLKAFVASLIFASSTFAAEPLQVWIMPNGASPQEKLESVLADFTKKTGLQTQVVVLDWGEAWGRISAALDGGKDLPAVLQLGTTWVPYFASRGTLMNLDPYKSTFDPSRFVPVSWNTTHVLGDSTIYSLPWFVDARALVANHRILSDNGVTAVDIATYDGFRKALQKIDAAKMALNDGTPIKAYAFPGKSDWNIPHNFAPWIWSAGGDFISVSPDGKIARSSLLDSNTIKGVANYLSFILSGIVDRESLSQNTAQITQRFNNGELGFVLNTAEIVMQTRLPPEEGGLSVARIGRDGVMIYPVPQGDAGSVSFIGGSNLAIPAKFKRQKEALKLLEYLTSDEAQDAYTSHIGFLPPSQKLLDKWSQDSAYTVLVGCLRTGRAYPAIPEWGDIENILVSVFSEIWAAVEFESGSIAEKLYGILVEGNNKLNGLFGIAPDAEMLTQEHFTAIWEAALTKAEGKPAAAEEAAKQEVASAGEEGGNAVPFTVGLFVIVVIAGFAFAYKRKKK